MATPYAAPNDGNSTHHLVLNHNGVLLGLNALDGQGVEEPLAFTLDDVPSGSLKVYSGRMKHADRGMPFEPSAQLTWGGGRGGFDFDKDTTKYYDGYLVDAVKDGQVILRGLPVYAYGDRTLAQLWQRNDGAVGADYLYGTVGVVAGQNYISSSFTPGITITTPAYVTLWANITAENLGGALTVQVRSGAGTVLYSGSLAASGLSAGDLRMVRIALSAVAGGALNAATTYWLVVTGVGWRVVLEDWDLSSSTSPDGVTWLGSIAGKIMYRLTEADTSQLAHFFEYKGAWYMAVKYLNGSVSRVYINGDCGVATGVQAANKLVDTTKAWGTNFYVGKIVKLVRGTGSEQWQPWRVIQSNTATELVVSPAWDIQPVAGSTEYVIEGTDDWNEVTGHGWPAGRVVTDVLVVNGAVYFAHGDSAALTRLIRYNNAGVWTTTWATETGQFTRLSYGSDQAGTYVWGAKGSYPAKVYKAAPSDWTAGTGGANLDFSLIDAINVGDLYDRITALATYGEYGSMHIFKETGIWHVWDDRPYQYWARAIESSKDYRNGRAVLAFDSFLYYSWHNSLFRYYRGQMDRISPDRDEIPLPEDRVGPVSALAGYPGLIIAAFDGGVENYSTVMAYNGQGWHELFRSPGVGQRILSLKVQSTQGDAVDRLWLTCGGDTLWLPLSEDPYNHPRVDYNFYPFAPGGTLASAWLYNGQNELEKFWNEIDVQGYNLSPTVRDVTVGVRLDASATFEHLSTPTGPAFHLIYPLDTLSDQVGRRLQVQYYLLTNNSLWTPRIEGTMVEALTRQDRAEMLSCMALVSPKTLDGGPDNYASALAKFNALSAMRNSALPAVVTSVLEVLNGRSGFVDLPHLRPIKVTDHWGDEAYAVEVRLLLK